MYKDTIYISKTAYLNDSPLRFAVRFNGNNSITDTVKYVWFSDSSYQIIETAVDGNFRVVSDLYLDRNYRDKAGKYIGYNDKDSIVFSEKYENTIGENGLLTRSVTTNLLQNTTSVLCYEYFDFDKFGNPTKILLTNLLDKKVVRIIMRTFAYY